MSAYAAQSDKAEKIVATAKAAPKATKKASTKKKAAQSKQKAQNKATTKAQSAAAKKERGKEQQLGLMPSELNELNHNIYHADADAIRGARDTESALRYIPFVTIVNTAGFGQQFDFRSQGRVSANGVKLFINGIGANPLDTYYGFMPINTVLPSLIQEIKVYPGGGAVLYGSGAKGAVIDIITSKRQRPYFSVGAGYVNASGGDNSYFAHAQASEKFGPVSLNAGLGYSQKGGPRESDNTQSIQVALGADVAINQGSSVFVDVDFYNDKTKTTPYNSFWDIEAARTAVAGAGNNDSVRAAAALATAPIEPDKDSRGKDGDGEIDNKQTRLTASLGYKSQVSDNLKWDLIGFFAYDERKYDTYTARIPFYQYPNLQQGTMVYFLGFNEGNSNLADQSGSKFNETKFGGKLKIDLLHTNGEFIFGIDSYYEKSKRQAIQNLKSANTDPDTIYSGISVDINNVLDLSRWTNAIYGIERYDFNDIFSVSAGLRYEMTKYSSKSNDYVSAALHNHPVGGTETIMHQTQNPQIPESSSTQNTGNFTLELSPVLRYSNTGVIYARYERGYTTLPPYAMSQRKGSINIATNATQPMNHDFTYEETGLKDETYNTYELGWKEFIGKENLYLSDALLFSLNGFYTDSKNEFYFTGDPYVGLSYGTYAKSRRLGGEVALEQYFLDGHLGFNESFTYVKAQYQSDSGEWKQIPYTYDYKATFGASANISAMIEIIDVSVDIWIQNSFYGKQSVSYSKFDAATQSVVVDENKKLKAYAISDFGVSFGFNKKMGTITVGVKNVFDTFYYDYYNHDISAPIGEYRYLIGQGRTVFIEGQYKY